MHGDGINETTCLPVVWSGRRVGVVLTDAGSVVMHTGRSAHVHDGEKTQTLPAASLQYNNRLMGVAVAGRTVTTLNSNYSLVELRSGNGPVFAFDLHHCSQVVGMQASGCWVAVKTRHFVHVLRRNHQGAWELFYECRSVLNGCMALTILSLIHI